MSDSDQLTELDDLVQGFGAFELSDEVPPNAPRGLDGQGEWVQREDSESHKSFGHFTCNRCKQVWISAHAYRLNFKQQCKRCRRWLFAQWLWANYEQDDADGDSARSESDDDSAPEKPHMASKCQACLRGIRCAGGRKKRNYY